jgi:general secretion pathway protein A
MYLEHFNLTERPFSITPDPRFLYMSPRHREALAHLLYGLGDGGGFVQLTGEVGTGKTTICRCLLEQIPENVDLALVLNPKVSAIELIATVCDELGIEYHADDTSVKSLTDVLNRYLLDAYARGRHTVLIIDEAQNLSRDVLEQVRLLTNLETSTQKLLQIILIGQPELRTLLAREDMRQLAQRVTARYHLEPISLEETGAYIRHRLQICGSSQTLFNKRSVDKIQQLSGGVPRLINVLCDRSMLGAFVEGKSQVDAKVVKKAATEVLAENSDEKTSRSRLPLLLGVVSILLVAGLAVRFLPWKVPDSVTVKSGRSIEELPASASGPVATVAAIAETGPQQSTDDTTDAVVVKPAPDPDPEPEPEPEQEYSSLATLLTQVEGSYERTAWTELFALWSVALPESVTSQDYCEFARQYGLQCLEEQGNWNTLRQFDRPAILTLVAADGEPVAVLLQQLDDSVAQVFIGDELYQLTTDQIEQRWYGDFKLLLQGPPGGRMFLRVGDRDPVVSWIRSQLEIAQGVIIPAADPMNFDYALQREILAFQRDHGLKTDGIVGKYTMMHLNTASGREGVPHLAPESS